MSTNFFINPTTSSSLTTNRNFDKSISMIEPSRNTMTYRSSEIANISRHLSDSTLAPVKQNYEDLVSCSICFDLFDSVNELKLPKILPCQHTYCVECIKNMIHCSNEKDNFSCPQCKFKVNNLKDSLDLPTSRIVLTLLEKESLNYQGYASCPCCRQIRNLEVCFECNLPLCVQCIGKHFESWKQDISQNCLIAVSTLESYKHKIDQIGPMIPQNFENVQTVKDEIEEAFRLLFQRLNTEKDLLLKSVNEIKDENAKYVNFKSDIVGLISSFKYFIESNESFEKKLMGSRMKKYQQYFEQIPKLEKEYSLLASTNFKLLEKFEKRTIPDLEFKFSGNLVIGEFSLEAPVQPPRRQLSTPSNTSPPIQNRVTIPKLEPLKENLKHVTSFAEYSRTGTPNTTNNITHTNTNINFDSNKDTLSRWMVTSQIKPQSELTLPYAPLHMSSYKNLLFCMDQSSYLSIYDKAYSVELRCKNSVKLNIPSVKSISVNAEYLALAYSGLKKEQLKGTLKNMNPSGVMLFRRDQHVVCSVYEKVIELGQAQNFRSLSGIALTEKFLFVCDRELRSVFKFDIKTKTLLKTTVLPDGDPFSISVNGSCVIVTCALNSVLYLFDAESLEQINSVGLKTIDQVNGALNSVLTEDNLIFIRNAENQIALLNSNLEQRAYFNEIPAKITNVSLICPEKSNDQMLVVGAINSKQQFKLFGYTI